MNRILVSIQFLKGQDDPAFRLMSFLFWCCGYLFNTLIIFHLYKLFCYFYIFHFVSIDFIGVLMGFLHIYVRHKQNKPLLLIQVGASIGLLQTLSNGTYSQGFAILETIRSSYLSISQSKSVLLIGIMLIAKPKYH